jgi:hypothetical protein
VDGDGDSWSISSIGRRRCRNATSVALSVVSGHSWPRICTRGAVTVMSRGIWFRRSSSTRAQILALPKPPQWKHDISCMTIGIILSHWHRRQYVRSRATQDIESSPPHHPTTPSRDSPPPSQAALHLHSTHHTLGRKHIPPSDHFTAVSVPDDERYEKSHPLEPE